MADGMGRSLKSSLSPNPSAAHTVQVLRNNSEYNKLR